VGAQEATSEAIQAARARVDSILPLLDSLRAERNAALEAYRARQLLDQTVPLDTVVVGPLRVVSAPRHRELAAWAFGEAWKEWAPLAAGSRAVDAAPLFAVRRGHETLGLTRSRGSFHWVSVGRAPRRGAMLDAVRIRLGEVLLGAAPPEVRAWTGGRPVLGRQRWAWVARELVTAPSLAARRCYRGEAGWCQDALGLADTTGGWQRWYTPAERRHRLEEMGPPRGDARFGAAWRGCLDEEREEACAALLAGMSPIPPLGAEARASFLEHVLGQGGEGSLVRLEEAREVSLGERLAHVAGQDLDTLTASWRRQVLAARPGPWADLASSPLAVLGWVLVLGALATRSTRCRLG
jgi:hypothetical protein